MTDFCISDTHFNHKNIIQYCNRPFKDMDHMREMMIANWNEVVGVDDTVWHFGDFAMGGSLEIQVPAILARLNGSKILIKGNHDHPVRTCKARGWTAIFEFRIMGPEEVAKMFRAEGFDELTTLAHAREVHMRHYNPTYPDMWPGHSTGTILLHGHSHGNTHGFASRKNSLDCGVDVWDYRPIRLTKAIMQAALPPEQRERRG